MTTTRPMTVLSGTFAVELLFAVAVAAAVSQSPAQVMESVRTATWGPTPLMLPTEAGIRPARLSPGVRGFVLMPADADHCTQGETTVVRDGQKPVEFACVKPADARRRAMSPSAGE